MILRKWQELRGFRGENGDFGLEFRERGWGREGDSGWNREIGGWGRNSGLEIEGRPLRRDCNNHETFVSHVVDNANWA